MRTRTTVWLPALGALLLVVVSQWQPHDSDSRLYAAMAEDLAARPWRLWLVPQWQGHWGREGLFVEHPAGHLGLAAALVRLGAPGTLAVAGLNVLAWACSLELVMRLGRYWGNEAVGRLAMLLWLCSPMFLQYLVRGNQEHPLAASVLAAVASLVLLPAPYLAAAGFALACGAGLALKGLAGLGALPLGWVAASLAVGNVRQRRASWLLGAAFLPVLVGLYLQAYAAASGQSFWLLHLAQQVGHSVGHGFVWRNKAVNLLFYLARPCWYALPAIVVGGWAARRQGLRAVLRGPLQRLGLAAACIYVGGFALADRKADRYLFALYPFLALAAAASCTDVAASAQACASRRAARLLAWAERCQAQLLLVAVFLKLVLGRFVYVFIRAWPGS